MPFDLSTKTALAARLTIAHCDRLPAGAQYVCVPRPEAGRFVCPHPCGQRCRLDTPALFSPQAVRRHACHLQLPQTLALLTAAAQQPAPPPACNLGEFAPARAACGGWHQN